MPREVASLESDDGLRQSCPCFRQLHDFARELRLACALLRRIRFGSEIFIPNDRSPDENVKRSAHDGQFPPERYLATQGLALAVQPAAGSLDRGWRRTRKAGGLWDGSVQRRRAGCSGTCPARP